MGNDPSKQYVSNIKQSISSKLHHISNNQRRKPHVRKIKKCKCALYTRTQNHCCLQICLRNSDRYSHLSKVWLFTDEHRFYLDKFLTGINLQDVTYIITEFLYGINSTLEEYSIFCHGSFSNNVHNQYPCKIWLQSKTIRPFHLEIIGSQNVGKTSLALRCAKNIYLEDDAQNMGSNLCIELKLKNVSIKVRIFDASSDGRMRPSECQLNDTDFVYLLCVDPSSSNYFEDFRFIQAQRYEISQQHNVTDSAHDAVRCAFIIIATKCDLKSQQYIYRSENVIRYCKDQNIPYIEVSARCGINMDSFLKNCIYELWIQTQTHCSS